MAVPHDDGWYVGSAMNGAFCQFKVLSETEWLLLRYLQNLAEQNRQLCPFTWKDRLMIPKRPPLNPERLRDGQKKMLMHIDGDVLRRVTCVELEEALLPDAQGLNYEPEVGTVEARVELLTKLAGQISPELVQDQLYARVVEWVRTFWEPLL